jgi:hypothetical protein
MKKLVLLCLFFAAMGALPAATGSRTAAQTGGWRVESAVSLADLLAGIDVPVQRTVPAPDGRHVAYFNGDVDAICVVELPTGTETCTPLPPESGFSYRPDPHMPALRWSPDSTRLALTGLPYLLFRDTDLTVVNWAGQQATIVSQDNQLGSVFFEDTVPGAILEVTPTWSPEGDQILVERVVADAEGEFYHAMLAVVDAETGAATELAPLPGQQPGVKDFGSVLEAAWSPNEETLAVNLLHAEPDPEIDGLWLYHMTDAAWQQVVSLEEATALLQAIYPEGFARFVSPVLWSPDGSILVFWAGDPYQFAGQIWCFWLNAETGDIAPIPLTPPTDPLAANYWPAQAVWSPEGDTLLVMVRHIAPVEGDVPLIDPASEAPLRASLHLVDPASATSTLLGYLPPSIQANMIAAWGPGDDVIAGDYYLKLARE